MLGIQNGKNAEKAWERGNSRRFLEHCNTPLRSDSICRHAILTYYYFLRFPFWSKEMVGKWAKCHFFFPRVARVGKVTGTHYIGFRGPVYSRVVGARKCDHIQYTSLQFSGWSWFHCLKGPKRRRSRDHGHTCWFYPPKEKIKSQNLWGNSETGIHLFLVFIPLYLKPGFCPRICVADNTGAVTVQWQITLGCGR